MMYSLLVVLVYYVVHVLGYGSGPPPSVCTSMRPSHGEAITQELSNSPYQLTVDKTSLKQGEWVRVTLSGTNQFKGFMVEGRSDPDLNQEPLGTFNQTGSKYLSCNGNSDNAVTHGNPSLKSAVTMNWRAPTDHEGNVKLKATVVQSFDTFWVGVESDALQVERPLVFPGSQQTTTTTTTTTPPRNLNQKQVEGFYSTCGTTHGCFGSGSCVDDKNCKMAAAYRKRDDGKYEIQLTGDAPGYVAIGFSEDDSMGNDAVVNCVNNGGVITAHKSYNKEGAKFNQRLQTQTGLSEVSGSYTDGILSCKFALEPEFEFLDDTFNLDEEEYHILLAASRDTSGYHDIGEVPSSEAVSLSDASVASASDKSDVLIKVHAALMIAAWVGSASLGIVMARYMKRVWPGQQWCGKDRWFQRHRLQMVITWVFTLVAFIIIFVHVKAWTSQTTNPHAYLGIITFILCFIQPFMALLRCGPHDSRRPIFNWAHWAVGNIAHICGMAAILFATDLTNSGLPKSFLWVMVAYVVIYVVFHIIFTLLDWMIGKGSLAKCSPANGGTGEVIGMHYRGTNGHNAQNGAKAVEEGSPKNGWVPPEPDTKRGETCKKCVWFIYEVITTVFSAVLIYLAVSRPGVDDE